MTKKINCLEFSLSPISGWRADAGLWRCPELGATVELSTPEGRRPARGGPYCEAHGGEPRARSEAEHEWVYLAPASVGGDDEVQAAGCLALHTVEAYVVIRREGGHWLAWLGLGSMLDPVVGDRPNGVARRWARRHPGEPLPERFVSRVFATRAGAIAGATETWARRVAARTEEIRSARGGTLEWGVPVEPLREPLIVEPADGETAWDVVQRTAPVAPRGLSAITGLRPSGEAA